VKIHVDMNLCQSHGECVAIAPDVFVLAPIPTLGRGCTRLHADHGVRLALGAGMHALRGGAGEAVEEVELQDGTQIEAGCVLVALGTVPNVKSLASSGLCSTVAS
jgi:hypothetical protein